MKICKNAKELRSLHKSEDLLLVAVQENNGNRNLVVCAFTENHEDSVAICTPSGLDLAPFLNGKVKNIWDLTKPNYGWETLTGNDPYMEALESFKEADGYILLKSMDEIKHMLVLDPGLYWVSITVSSNKIDDDAFENHLCERCDIIHNAVHTMVCDIAGFDVEWDMSYIGEIADCVVSTLHDTGIPVCYPSYLAEPGNTEHRCVDEDECPVGCPHCVLKSDSPSSEEIEEDEEDDEDEPLDENIHPKPVYDYLVAIGDSAEFNFNIYHDAVGFCKEYKRIMNGDEKARKCTLYKYDRENDCYTEILLEDD